MAKVIDTRVDGRGLKYTAYDTKLVDYAKAPKTGIDPDKKFKINLKYLDTKLFLFEII